MRAVVQFNDDPAEKYAQALKVCELLCEGIDRYEVAKKVNVSIDEVEQALIRVTGGVSPAIRERHLLLLVARLEKIQAVYYKKAINPRSKNGNEAANTCMKANDFTARLLALYPPPNTQHSLENRPQETTTEQIQAAIDRIRGVTTRTIDGEVTEVKDGD